ncbi:MAG: WYL domain-containing protein [Myxococcota bacterium]
MQSFLSTGTWSQAELARRAATSPETIRKTMEDLQGSGWPLERQADHPQVYWSLPRGWLPSGVHLPLEDVSQLLRLLVRLPESAERDRFLEELGEAIPEGPRPSLEAWLHVPRRRAQETHLVLIEDAIRDATALAISYFSVSRGLVEDRDVSFQRIQRRAETSCVGYCHRSGTLKWFRLDRVMQIEGPAAVPYQRAPVEELDAYVDSTIRGFRSSEDLGESVFFVADPAARWLRTNPPRSMTTEAVERGVRVTAQNVSIRQVARYVVGFGGLARPESPELLAAVREFLERVGNGLDDSVEQAGSRES